jgi:acyl-CoA synthetase (AMP-forming)/AMP-acid ligase II
LTYKQAQHRVLSLAKELRDAGCDRDRVVAIFMDPSPSYVVGMLAALSAGGAVSESQLHLLFVCTFVHF